MAATILTGNALAVRQYDLKMHYEVYTPLFWREAGLMGVDVGEENSVTGNKPYYPIVEKEDFNKNRGKGGDTIRMKMARKLTGAGSYEGTDPTGSSYMEAQSFDYFDAMVGVRRHQTLLDEARVSQGRVNFDIEKENVESLGRHGAEKVENDIFKAFYFGYSDSLVQNSLKSAVKHPNWYFASSQPKGWTSDKEATCGDPLFKFGTSVINRAKVIARRLNFVPAKWKGKENLICVCSEEQLQDLYEDPRWQSNAEKAGNRGDDNPLWEGIPAGGRYNGVFIFSNNRVSVASDDTVPGGENIHRAIFTGAHAVAFGMDGETRYTTLREDKFQSRVGRGYEMLYGASRLDWTAVGNQSSLIFSTYAQTAI